MRERLIMTLLIHLAGISLLLFPNKYQGPVVTVISDIQLRALDAVALIIVLAGSVFLYASLFLCLRSQLKLGKQLPPGESAEKTE